MVVCTSGSVSGPHVRLTVATGSGLRLDLVGVGQRLVTPLVLPLAGKVQDLLLWAENPCKSDRKMLKKWNIEYNRTMNPWVRVDG